MSDLLGTGVAATAALLGAAIDLRTGRIPNALTGSAALAGLIVSALGWSAVTPAMAVAGGAVGLVLMLPQHLFGGTGAGDVKLMAAVGTLLGPHRVLMVVLFSAILGGVLAIGHASRRGRLRITMARTAQFVTAPQSAKQDVDSAALLTRFAYGPAIAGGVILAALWH
jgi:prepilin peptidase CpaA